MSKPTTLYDKIWDDHLVANNPDGRFQVFCVGDAVAGRNIHAAIYDSLRLCKDI